MTHREEFPIGSLFVSRAIRVSDELLAHRDGGSVAAVGRPELAQDAADMVSRRFGTDEELLGNLGIGQALAQQSKHLRFPLGEPEGNRRERQRGQRGLQFREDRSLLPRQQRFGTRQRVGHGVGGREQLPGIPRLGDDRIPEPARAWAKMRSFAARCSSVRASTPLSSRRRSAAARSLIAAVRSPAEPMTLARLASGSTIHIVLPSSHIRGNDSRRYGTAVTPPVASRAPAMSLVWTPIPVTLPRARWRASPS